MDLKSIIQRNYMSESGRIRSRTIPKEIEKQIRDATNFCHPDEPLNVRCRFVLNDVVEAIICKTCGVNILQKKIEKNHFKSYCSHACLNQDHKTHIKKRKKTCVEKYGVENPMQDQRISKKCQHSKQNTVLEKYGVKNVFQLSDVKEKIKISYQEKYGVAHPMQLETTKQKHRTTMKDRYGCYNIAHAHIVESNLNILNDFEKLSELYNKHGLYETTRLLEVSEMTLRKYLINHGIIQPFENVFERTIGDWLAEKNIKYHTNDRRIIGPKELDIVIPDHKLAIEINGDYWHSEEFSRDKTYHLSKTQTANDQGYTLLQFWSHQLIKNSDIVRSMIYHRLGVNYKSVYARQLKCVQLSKKKFHAFLNEHHLQGMCGSSVNIGLVDHTDTIYAVMGFSRPRFAEHTEWEMTRFAVAKYHNVPGAASRLFAYFTSKNTGSVISYADRNISSGNVYQSLGFKFSHFTSPSYHYVAKNGQILSRYQCQKHKLISLLDCFDDNQSERINMMNNGYYRVWNTGNSVWIKE